MKALFYKSSVTLRGGIFILLYFWILMPFGLESLKMNVFTSPFLYLTSGGIIYILEQGNKDQKAFNEYIPYLPIERSTRVSYLFILVIAANLLTYLFSLILSRIMLAVSENFVFTAVTPFYMLSSMLAALALTGLSMLISFKFSNSVSYVFYMVLYFGVSFGIGVVNGFYAEAAPGEIFFNSTAFRAAAAVISAAVFTFEWWLSIRVYNKKDL